MGTWDIGPFDSDAAADFCDCLDEAPEADRPGLIRDALVRLLDAGDPLYQRVAVEAVAAAALATLPYRPGPAHHQLVGRPGLPIPVLPDDLPDIAVRALDPVEAEPSELRGLRAETDDVHGHRGHRGGAVQTAIRPGSVQARWLPPTFGRAVGFRSGCPVARQAAEAGV
ncbi:uncharacterized protein DUF4259 [Streptomyces sp. 2132.2]|uniref:DUF4259 domain-containing protein n=1 Tax=Streptomyces sp. 2132.2 TaxID=2485161 RepID=UPI000F47A5F4|nr:DUF4259 domain-containing protein [Streptomyces sp. 2132.2]ROQ89017.1 uncharacterized protein DUF4259 [Streptomyces sp. 2132.2]